MTSLSVNTMEMLQRMQEISLVAKTKPGLDSDWVDRIAGGVSASLLVAFGLFIGAKQYFGTVIDCWTPPEFTWAMDAYATEFCFVNSTYWAPDDKELPDNIEARESAKLPYYQWVPWMLGLQALLFLIPHIIWRLFNWKSGLNVKFVVSRASELQSLNRVDRVFGDNVWDRGVKALANYLSDSLQLNRKYLKALNDGDLNRSFLWKWFSPVSVFGGTRLSWLYVFIKLITFIFAIAQLFILQTFLDRSTSFYGWKILMNYLNGSDWSTIGLFPRITYCDFTTRIIGNQNQRFTLQCVLSLNMLNEKIYTFLWFWLIFIIIIVGYSLITWLHKTIFGFSNRNFIASYLKIGIDSKFWAKQEGNEQALFDEFERSYLTKDCVFVLRFVSWNSGVYLTGCLIAALYSKFCDLNKDAKIESIVGGRNGIPLQTIISSKHESAEAE